MSAHEKIAPMWAPPPMLVIRRAWVRMLLANARVSVCTALCSMCQRAFRAATVIRARFAELTTLFRDVFLEQSLTVQAVQQTDGAFDVPFMNFVIDWQRQNLFCGALSGRAHALAIPQLLGFRIRMGMHCRNKPIA